MLRLLDGRMGGITAGPEGLEGLHFRLHASIVLFSLTACVFCVTRAYDTPLYRISQMGRLISQYCTYREPQDYESCNRIVLFDLFFVKFARFPSLRRIQHDDCHVLILNLSLCGCLGRKSTRRFHIILYFWGLIAKHTTSESGGIHLHAGNTPPTYQLLRSVRKPF